MPRTPVTKTPDGLGLSYMMLRRASDRRFCRKHRELFRVVSKALYDLDFRVAELETETKQEAKQS